MTSECMQDMLQRVVDEVRYDLGVPLHCADLSKEVHWNPVRLVLAHHDKASHGFILLLCGDVFTDICPQGDYMASCLVAFDSNNVSGGRKDGVAIVRLVRERMSAAIMDMEWMLQNEGRRMIPWFEGKRRLLEDARIRHDPPK